MKSQSLSLLFSAGLILASLIFLSTIALPIVQAGLVFQQGQEVELKVPCTVDDRPCGSAANCNLTVHYPNSSYMINSSAMTNLQTGDFSYTDTFNVAGLHQSRVSCIEGGQNGTSTFEINITPSGVDETTGWYYWIIGLSVVIMIIGFYLGDPYITIFGSIGLYFVGIYFVRYGVGNRINTTSMAMSVVLLGMAAYISIKSVFEVIRNNYG